MVGHCQTVMATGSDNGVINNTIYITITLDSSVLERLLMINTDAAMVTEEAITTNDANISPSTWGRKIIKVPKKPTNTAAQRRQLTSSFKNKAAPMVTNKGTVKLSATALANGNTVMPQK